MLSKPIVVKIEKQKNALSTPYSEIDFRLRFMIKWLG